MKKIENKNYCIYVILHNCNISVLKLFTYNF